MPDAWDGTKQQTITCPVSVRDDGKGGKVTVPGIVCVQGTDSDTAKATGTTVID